MLYYSDLKLCHIVLKLIFQDTSDRHLNEANLYSIIIVVNNNHNYYYYKGDGGVIVGRGFQGKGKCETEEQGLVSMVVMG